MNPESGAAFYTSLGGSYYIAYSESPMPSTIMVEGEFDNGYVASDQTTAGVYILVGLDAAAICELRMLGADNNVLSTIDLSLPESNCVR
jgi:hypothetical protein